VNIAWKLAFVLRGWAPPALLASYEAERRGVVEQTVASAAANMRALPADLAADADAIQRVKAPEFHNLGLVLGYSYFRTRPCVAHPPHPDPGTRRLPRAGIPAGPARPAHRLAGGQPGGHRPGRGGGRTPARLTGPGDAALYDG
jgi:hypothetical protein